jgi:hypothetical protein
MIKKLLITFILIIGVSLTALSQTAVYVDYNNGSVGYSTGHFSFKLAAYNNAVRSGANNPTKLLSTRTSGYVFLVRGYNTNTQKYSYGIAYGYSTRRSAKTRAVRELKRAGYSGRYRVVASFYGY